MRWPLLVLAIGGCAGAISDYGLGECPPCPTLVVIEPTPIPTPRAVVEKKIERVIVVQPMVPTPLPTAALPAGDTHHEMIELKRSADELQRTAEEILEKVVPSPSPTKAER